MSRLASVLGIAAAVVAAAAVFCSLENDKPIANPVWLDTVNVTYRGTVDVIMDFTDPVIRGMSAFHCHLLNHEDKGMMAKILFE
jgi:suppressor of ftsI